MGRLGPLPANCQLSGNSHFHLQVATAFCCFFAVRTEAAAPALDPGWGRNSASSRSATWNLKRECGDGSIVRVVPAFKSCEHWPSGRWPPRALFEGCPSRSEHPKPPIGLVTSGPSTVPLQPGLMTMILFLGGSDQSRNQQHDTLNRRLLVSVPRPTRCLAHPLQFCLHRAVAQARLPRRNTPLARPRTSTHRHHHQPSRGSPSMSSVSPYPRAISHTNADRKGGIFPLPMATTPPRESRPRRSSRCHQCLAPLLGNLTPGPGCAENLPCQPRTLVA